MFSAEKQLRCLMRQIGAGKPIEIFNGGEW
jgi:hypothetical protein